jgi:pilus assembly protein Flp/PilA
MKALLIRFAKDRSGATAIEYALIGGLISIAIVAGALAVGNALDVTYNGLDDPLVVE